MKQVNPPSFDSTMTQANIQALMFPATSFKELEALEQGSCAESSLRRPDAETALRKQFDDAAVPAIDALAPTAAEPENTEASDPDGHATRRTAMMARRRRRAKKGLRAKRYRGGPRLSMY